MRVGAPRAVADLLVTAVPELRERRADELTARLRARFPAVRALRFTLGRLEEAGPSAAPRRRPRSSAPLGAADLRAIDEAISPIPDPALAAAARRLLTKAWRFPAERGAER